MNVPDGTKLPEWPELARDLTFEQKQLIASGRGGEVAPAIHRRAKRRLNLNSWSSVGIAFLALNILAVTGPILGSAWVKIPSILILGGWARFSFVMAHRTYAAELAYARHLEDLAGEAETP